MACFFQLHKHLAKVLRSVVRLLGPSLHATVSNYGAVQIRSVRSMYFSHVWHEHCSKVNIVIETPHVNGRLSATVPFTTNLSSVNIESSY